MEDKITISLKCMFCASVDLEVIKNESGMDTDKVLCKNCNKINSMYILKRVATRHGVEDVKEQLDKMLKKIFKKR